MSESKKKMTIDEQIAKLAARLAELKAQRAKISRKDRNSQLVACGIVVENMFGRFSGEFIEEFKKAAEAQTDERIRKQALEFIQRLQEEKAEKKTLTLA
jgi:hypothetical protein